MQAVVFDEFAENVSRSEIVGYVRTEAEIMAILESVLEEDELRRVIWVSRNNKWYVNFK